MATSNRRDVLKIMVIGVSAGLLWLAGAAQGILAFWFPPAPYEPSKKNKIGRPEDFPRGETKMLNLGKENVFVFHDDEGLYAMSARCTHLGCSVSQTEEGGFLCPCHGSLFDANGINIEGPAPAPLRWLEMSYSPDGRIVVDRGKFVDAGSAAKLTIIREA